MVGTVNFAMVLRGFYFVEDPFADNEIVNSPTRVLFPGVEAVAPPGVFDLLGIKGPVDVDEAVAQQVGEGLAFFFCESGVVGIALGVLEVDGLVGDVEVPAVDDRLDGVELFEIGNQILFVFEAEGEALEFFPGVGDVGGDEIEVLVFEGDDPSFLVVFATFQTIGDGEGLLAGIGGDPGIALPQFGGSEIEVVVLESDGEGFVFLSRPFGFVEGEDVGVEVPEGLFKALGEDGPDAVDVPCCEFHDPIISEIPFWERGSKRFLEKLAKKID